jgi:cytochrome c-type biogenesis protein CcmF
MNIQYAGEHLLPGILGKTFIWGSFAALLLSLVFYIYANRESLKKRNWRNTADAFYMLHFLFLAGAIFCLYHLIFNHYFEYSYVWQYTSRDLPVKLLFSSLWAGQEGSFLTWAILQGILGLILLRSAREWKSWVMPVFLTGQFFLLSMVLGLDIAGFRIGGAPFALLREMPQNAGLDLFRDHGYVALITDGNGLNPLLENIWMVIHPPALFLGYAFALIPFSYAVASLWKSEYHTWIRPALPWNIAAVLSLGFGILLGGRWAYESLTFGGFWAWDPVENASLVPWLFQVAALHLMLITSKRSHSYGTTYLFTLLGWIFVVYATYLTRSGVLGETSVHAFGDSGMALQMLIFNAIFLAFPLILLLMNRKHFPKKGNEEFLSREFWMLIGSVIVMLSAFQIILTTSIPAINKVLGTTIAPPVDNVSFYNTWQLPFALLILLLIGFSQYLDYGKNNLKVFTRTFFRDFVISLAITILIVIMDGITRVGHILLLYFTVFSALVSFAFLIKLIRKTSNLGSLISHLGFAVFILGVLLAFSNSEVISKNTSGKDLGSNEENAENLVLTKGISMPMGPYFVKYSDSETRGRETFYRLDFRNQYEKDSSKVAFSVFPSVNRNMRMGNVYNPDTKHFISKDVYTYISFAQKPQGPADSTGYSRTAVQEMQVKDTLVFARSFVILDSVEVQMINDDLNNVTLSARLRILSMQHGAMEAGIRYRIVNGELVHDDAVIEPLGLKLRFESISDKPETILVGFYEKNEDFIVIKAVIFPFMNIMWVGAVILFLGLTYSIIRRIGKNKNESNLNLEVQNIVEEKPQASGSEN